jgi:hypothetical protein
MSKKEIVTIQKTLDHPLEDVFDIEPGTTLITREEQRTELITVEDYDVKDSEIEEQMQEVYDKAMSGYGIIQDECEDIEGKYKARMMEVGVQHLKMALDAAEAKARMKEMKDKLRGKAAAGSGPKTVNNNLFVNREDLLKTLMAAEEKAE